METQETSDLHQAQVRNLPGFSVAFRSFSDFLRGATQIFLENLGIFHPKIGEDEPILTIIFFKRVVSPPTSFCLFQSFRFFFA